MKKEHRPTRHHIIPTSRGGEDLEENIVYVPEKQHQMYHCLFGNRTPREIVEYLNRDFWNEHYTGIEKRVI
jgi:5-methylcytosine-specific restriction endonuclease McrA